MQTYHSVCEATAQLTAVTSGALAPARDKVAEQYSVHVWVR